MSGLEDHPGPAAGKPAAGGNALNRIFQAQRLAFLNNPVPEAQERVRNLKRLNHAIVTFRHEIAEALNADYGSRSRDETLLGEILPSAEAAAFAARHVRAWMKPQKRSPGLLFQPVTARVLYQPLGVVGIITPWNYPLFLSMGPLTGVLAAGNRAMIRMSRNTPATSETVARMITATFDPDLVWVVPGDAGSGSEFSRKPWDHLIFTGSSPVGRQVMRSAADSLTPVTLELGGKSPAIIGPDADLDTAARCIAFGKLFNAGQTCVAPDHVLCPKNRVEDFADLFTRAVATMYPTLAANPDYTAIIDNSQLLRLKSLIDDARQRGARVVTINPAQESFEGTRKLPVVLLLDTGEGMIALKEEIFGPVLPVLPYTTLDEAIARVNGSPRPLALYYFGRNRKQADLVIQQTRSGGVVINDTLIHAAQDDLPFGGIGESGMGHYHAREGFLAFSKARPVMIKNRFNSGSLIYPPYGRSVHRWLYRLIFR